MIPNKNKSLCTLALLCCGLPLFLFTARLKFLNCHTQSKISFNGLRALFVYDLHHRNLGDREIASKNTSEVSEICMDAARILKNWQDSRTYPNPSNNGTLNLNHAIISCDLIHQLNISEIMEHLPFHKTLGELLKENHNGLCTCFEGSSSPPLLSINVTEKWSHLFIGNDTDIHGISTLLVSTLIFSKMVENLADNSMQSICISSGGNVRTRSFFSKETGMFGLFSPSGRYGILKNTRRKLRGRRKLAPRPKQNQPTQDECRLKIGSAADSDVVFEFGDEFCKRRSSPQKADYVQYWDGKSKRDWDRNILCETKKCSSSAYFPLGPRFEFGTIRNRTSLLPSTNRSILVNFMGAVNTSPNRQSLKNVLGKMTTGKDKVLLKNLIDWQGSQPQGFIHIAGGWSGTPSAKNDYIPPQVYRSTLLNSVFTLTPNGHNPESFRFFEALEAGSIPIICMDGTYTGHNCKDAFHPLLNSGVPHIAVNNWQELPSTLGKLLKNVSQIEELQSKIAPWRSSFYSDLLSRFESTLAIRLAIKDILKLCESNLNQDWVQKCKHVFNEVIAAANN